MKKALTIVSSAVLAAAAILPAYGIVEQAKKVVSPTAGVKANLTMKAQTRKAPSKTGFHMANARQIEKSNGFATSRTKATLKKTDVFKANRSIAGFPEMGGLVIYMDGWTDSSAMGLYNVASDGNLEFRFNTLNGAGYPVEDAYWVSNYTRFWGMVWIEIQAYDLESGEQIASFDPEGLDNIFIDFAKDPSTGTIYGIGYNSAGDGLQLSSVDFDLDYGMTVTPIASLEGNWNSLACSADGQLYGISYSGETIDDSYVVTSSQLCKIDKATAAATVVGETGMCPQYLSSSDIDPKTGKMYWAVCTPDEEGFLAEVNLETGAATRLFTLENNAEVQGLYIATPAAEDGAPARVEEIAADFQDGSLSGTVSFTAPTVNYDGSAASGALTYNVGIDGESVATGSTQYGAFVEVPVTVPASGYYTFTATVENSVGVSPVAKVKLFVGNGTPVAPTATLVYENGNMNLTWTPVTETIEGGYIDPAAVTYTVTRFPEDVVVYEGSATSFSEAIAVPASLTQYYYTVVAHAAGVNSNVATSNSVSLGNIVPPYDNTFDTVDDVNGFTTIDANGDGRTWTWYDGAVRVAYNASMEMDDWFITPAIKLEAGKMYKVAFDAKANSSDYPERIEVMWGNAPTAEAMTNEILAPTDLLTNAYESFENFIAPATDGDYYIGFHGISDADMLNLFIDNLSISAPMSAAVPATVTNLTATPNPDGEVEATISFTTPTLTMAGNALTNITEVTVSRGDQVVKTFTNPGVGVELSYVDTPEVSGITNYTVVAYNEEGAGKEANVSVFVGVDKPAYPENITMTEEGNSGTVVVNWDAVSKDQNGNNINPSLVTYMVAENDGSGWVPVSDVLTTTTFTYDAVPAGEQDFVQLAVFAITDGGESGALTPLLAVGTPYNGMEESFADGGLDYIWATGFSDSEQGGAWNLYTDEDLDVPASDGDNGYAAMKGEYLEASAGLFTGKISLAGAANPGVSFYTWNIMNDAGDPDINEIQVYVLEQGADEWVALGNPVVVDEINPGEPGWHQAAISLADFAGKTVQVRFQATVKFYIYTMLDQVKVGNLTGYDIAVTGINAPANVLVGNDYNVEVTIANKGMQEANDFTVNIYADGQVAQSRQIQSLASGTTANVSFAFLMPELNAEAVNYYAEVVFADDEEDANNISATVTVNPKESNLPAVTDLSGTVEDHGIMLTWSEPDASSGPAAAEEVDFEDGESWAMEYEGWTFLDGDESAVGGFQGNDLPGITPGTTTASFFIFDSSEDGFNQTFAAHSGDKYLAALFRYDDGTTDDWAISPVLSGDAQTISFFAKSYSSSFPEKIEMYYSLGGIERDDFTLVKTVATVRSEWTEYTFDVPVGATYFAIRSCATGSFMLMMDDFTFAREGGAVGDLNILGYNVYRNGVKINSELVEECEYFDAVNAHVTYSYNVIAVYANGISAPSNTLQILYTGVNDAVSGKLMIAGGKGEVVVAGAEGKALTISTADGKVIFNGVAATRENVAAPAGVYVVTVEGKTVKVAVK